MRHQPQHHAGIASGLDERVKEIVTEIAAAIAREIVKEAAMAGIGRTVAVVAAREGGPGGLARKARRNAKSMAIVLMEIVPMATDHRAPATHATKTAPGIARRRARSMATGLFRKGVAVEAGGRRGRAAMPVQAESPVAVVASDRAEMKWTPYGRRRCNSVASRVALPL